MKRWPKYQQERVRATLAAIDEHYPVAKRGELLTIENPKTSKGSGERGYLAVVMHLAAASSSGADVCPWSVGGCRDGCLTYAGRGGIALDASGWNPVQAARIRRTARMILWPDAFAYDLLRELDTLRRRADAEGLGLAVRLNGTSDIPWHRTAPDLLEEVKKRADAVYEYTKRPKPDALAAGVDVTYSYPGGNGDAARRYLWGGARVAVVFDTPKGEALPLKWAAPWGQSVSVIDGDAHDLRFLDPSGVVVGLRAKGRLVGVAGTARGFVQPSA